MKNIINIKYYKNNKEMKNIINNKIKIIKINKLKNIIQFKYTYYPYTQDRRLYFIISQFQYTFYKISEHFNKLRIMVLFNNKQHTICKISLVFVLRKNIYHIYHKCISFFYIHNIVYYVYLNIYLKTHMFMLQHSFRGMNNIKNITFSFLYLLFSSKS